MPVIGFRNPVTQETIPLDKAAEVFDHEGIAPADVIQAMIDDIQGGTHARGVHLSPSILNPEMTCRRKIVGERYLDHVVDPLDFWAALEGTFFHRTMVEAGKNLPEWQTNVRMPKQGESSNRVEMEVFPGLWLSGEADRIRNIEPDGFELVDHKTSRYAKVDYGPRNVAEWAIQVNLYRYMYEDLTGRKCKGLWVWRTYRGSYEQSKTFRKFPIPMIPREKLREQIGEWALSLQVYLLGAESMKDDQNKVLAMLGSVPTDGIDHNIMGGWLCNHCPIQRQCFALAGKVTF